MASVCSTGVFSSFYNLHMLISTSHERAKKEKTRLSCHESKHSYQQKIGAWSDQSINLAHNSFD